MGKALKLNENVEMCGDIDLKGNEVINFLIPQSDNALAVPQSKMVKDIVVYYNTSFNSSSSLFHDQNNNE